MAYRIRAVFYARVSTEEEKQLNALEKQIQENKDIIEEMGWELVGEYIDEGKTGTTTKRRSDYRKMLDDLEEDKFDVVVCKDQDRLQRNTLDWYLFVDKLITNGKKLYLYLDHKFFKPAEDALITGVRAIMAEEYSRNLSKKLNNANRKRVERALKGEEVSAMGNGKSLGFAIKDRKWVQVPEEIELCKIMWDLYDKYDSLRKVRDWVNQHGYTNSVGKPFTTESISRILKNEKAKGVIVMGHHHHDFDKKKIVKRPEEDWVRIPAPELAYVTEERFDRVQARLKAKTGKKRGKFTGNHPLSGRVICGKCGRNLWRHQSNGYYSWYCASKMAKGEIACEGVSISDISLKKIYKHFADNLQVNRKEIKRSLLEWLKSLQNDLSNPEVNKSTLKEIKRLGKHKEKLTEAYLDEIISKDDYKVKYTQIESSLEELKSTLVDLENNEDLKEIQTVIDNIDAEIDEYIKTAEFEENKTEFLIEHTVRIIVLEKNHVVIELDLVGGVFLAGKDFLLYVHDSMPFPNGRIYFQRYDRETWFTITI